MSDYNRTTRECTVSQLQPELRQAIQSYFQEHELGNPEAETLMCCETISTRKSSGWLPAMLKGTEDATTHTGMLLTSEWLIWVRKGEHSDIVLTAANLKEIQVKMHPFIFMKDTGLEISGFIRDTQSQVQGYVGMGPESATQKFFEEVEKAIKIANPPSPSRKLPKWLGG